MKPSPALMREPEKWTPGRFNLLFGLWAVFAFLAAQRFTLSPVAGYICLLPWAAAIWCFYTDIASRNAFLLLALFWSIDNAVLEYGGTIGLVRYAIYLTVVLSFIADSVVRIQAVIGTCIITSLYLIVTLAHGTEDMSTTQFKRDILLMFLLGMLFIFQSKRPFQINTELLMYAMTGYALSECLNFFVFKEAWYGEYMNYDSTKYLIALPSLVAVLARRSALAVVLIALTIPVLVGYTSRTLLLSYLVALIFVIGAFQLRQGLMKRLIILMCVAIGLTALAAFDYATLFERYKALNMALIIQLKGAGAIEALDPVRYASSAMFFDLPLLDILFGRGWGSGLQDVTSRLSFVSPDQAAFSLHELNSNYYYNFHDVWVDIGLRFGIVPFSAFLFWLVRRRPHQSREGMAFWLLALIGIVSAFYGTASLVSIFFLIRVVTGYRP